MSLLQWCNWRFEHFCFKNQIFHYTRCNTPKRAASLRGPFPRHCARVTQLLSTKCRSGGKPIGNDESDLTGRRFELLTYRSRDERVIPLDQLYNFNHCKSFVQGVLNVAYQFTCIISIQSRYVSFETPCIYFLTNLAKKYYEQNVDASDKTLYTWVHLQIIATVCHLKE